ncbi:hypothetical protein [Pseudomonas sp. FP2309]|nr:hypothetical protein [Pseudomonas sp. FP2309]WLH66256.1 hypothetical protein PSH59_13950 [Pseudomonas sp. FP2309]
MQSHDAPTKMLACRHFAMEKKRKRLDPANALRCDAFDLLDRPDHDEEMA